MKQNIMEKDDDAAIKLVGFVDVLSGGLITNGLGVLSDKVENFRLIQALSLRDKLEAELTARGITKPRAIRPKILIPLLEEATLEDDDELQSRYANLLANASDPNYKGNIQRSFVTILAGLEPIDVAVLDFVFEESVSKKDNINQAVTAQFIMNVLDYSRDDIVLALDNLKRNGLIISPTHMYLFVMTNLGKAFVEAVQSLEKKERSAALDELQRLGQEYEAL